MINRDHELDITLLRMARQRRQKLPQGLGSSIDQYEAQQRELELAIAMMASQSAIERQKAEELKNQIVAQIQTATAQIISFLNAYQKSMFDKIYSQVKVSEDSLKFKGTDIYDMSFVSNMDYSKITVFNDTKLMEKRPDRREEYRQNMKNMKGEYLFAEALIKMTNPADSIYPDLYDQKNYFLKEYYLAAIAFYQESTVIGFLMNPTNNLENLKEFIEYNSLNIQSQVDAVNAKRLAMGEVAYAAEIDKIRYIERMVVTAKARLKYLMQAYEGKWKPPTLETIRSYAVANDLTYSRAVYELNEKSRETLCIPDWVLSIAEMYNQIEVFEQGPAVVSLNPFDSRWIRKAKAVIDLESDGVKHTSAKLFKAINEYWFVLTFGFQELEDYHLEGIIDKALNEDKTALEYRMSNDFYPVNFDDDMQGFLSKAFKSIKKAASKAVKLVKNAAGVLVDATRVITAPVARAVKSGLDNTLGRVLPESIYSKIATMTDAGLNILQLNLNKQTFRQIVDSAINISMIGVRINKEILGKALQQGFFKDVDKYSGGLLTSAQNLNKAGITLSKGGEIDWKMTALDALKVGLAVAAGSSLATGIAVQYTGEKTGLDKTSFGVGVLSAAAMIATQQATFGNELAKGATTMGTKSLVNSTGLGDSSIGRSVASIGVSAAVGSIQANTAFSQELRDRAEDKLKEVAKKQANEALKDVTDGKIDLVKAEKIAKLAEEGIDFYNSDKTISGILDKAKEKFDQQVATLKEKASNLTMAEIQEKASAESDRFIQKRLNEIYDLPDKYSDKLVEYLMKKYGPRSNYDDVIQPDDYLNYQIDQTLPNQRIFNNVVYTKNSAGKVFLGVAAVGAVAFLATQD